MNKFIYFALLMPVAMAANGQQKFDPPVTKTIPVRDTLHKVMLTDNYHWLEDHKNENVIKWTQQQRDYGVEYLARTQKVHMDFDRPW